MKEALRRIVIAPVIAGLLIGALILGAQTPNTPSYTTPTSGATK